MESPREMAPPPPPHAQPPAQSAPRPRAEPPSSTTTLARSDTKNQAEFAYKDFGARVDHMSTNFQLNAQLVGQKFYPPKIFGRWTEPEESPEYKAKDLGMKIVRGCHWFLSGRVPDFSKACGFEMLYQESKSRKVPSEAISVRHT